METIILYVIIALFLIGIPVLLARLTGSNPLEFLVGNRVNHTIFGKKKNDSEDVKENRPSEKKETNSSKNDLMDLISILATYARKNRFRLIVPGTLTSEEGKTAVLTAILLTRSTLIGVNCFGFGGSVLSEPGESDWTQTMNGIKTVIPSPVKKNRLQRELVRQILAELGKPEVPVEVIGVFTSPSVRLTQRTKTTCCTKKELSSVLQTDRFLADKGIDPAELEKLLEPKVLRAKGQKQE